MASDPAAAAGGGNFAGQVNVRVVVVGEAGTGKSSLIVTVATESFPENVPHVLPPTRLPSDYYPDRVPITIIDTSSRPEHKAKLIADCKAADVIVLTYACDRPSTLDRLSTYWLPELRRLEVKVPVLVVGCKLDLRDDPQQVSLDQVMAPIMQQFREIETCIECSAVRQIQVQEVFYYAQKAVLHPTAPLFDQETQSLKPRCTRALKRIFILCDNDRDGALSDAELNNFQVRCFNAPLQPSEIVGVKRVVQEKIPEGVNDRGLTLTGFLFLHALFIERGRLETTWSVLRKFGYDNDLKLKDELLPTTFKLASDQTVELRDEALDFLKDIFHIFDIDSDGALRPSELDELFSTAPENPWSESPYKDSAEKNVLGGLSLDGFISEWALMTLQDPKASLANLIYIGYTGDPASVFHVTRKRRLDRKKQRTQRNVFQCFVFGPKNAGKTTLLNSFIGRTFSEKYAPTTSYRFATNVVDLHNGTKKILVMREIPEQEVKNLLSNKESLAACDIAVFIYDSFNEESWKRTKELLEQVAHHGENTGFEVPCLIISAKDDLDAYTLNIQDSTRVTLEMGIESPIPISMKLRDHNDVFYRIVSAAQQPHLSIPETEAGKSRKQYRRFINQSLVFISVGAAVAVAGLAAYRIYAARKNTSG
ncbi:mitochondrial Rho GTPase 1-like isoform X1 [Zingiber officinale]|uniref:mitochondrial Rho GTPase 1-like isoform X1 n=1 Tax=Zingiber officinale TaxID=94328 RepID=UPI001C4D594E|nr:mitochondrial Rho GTPase 1-like isoform X1 [Zingiber officinale]